MGEGFLYAITTRYYATGIIKIGISRNPPKRLGGLAGEASTLAAIPKLIDAPKRCETFKILGAVLVDDAKVVERATHLFFAPYHVAHEWFKVDWPIVLEFFRTLGPVAYVDAVWSAHEVQP